MSKRRKRSTIGRNPLDKLATAKKGKSAKRAAAAPPEVQVAIREVLSEKPKGPLGWVRSLLGL